MFENVSQKIKTMAMVMVVIASIASIVLVILGLIAADYSGLLFGIAIAGAIVLFLGVLCCAYFVYGFGELIENTTELRNSIQRQMKNTGTTQKSKDDNLPEL